MLLQHGTHGPGTFVIHIYDCRASCGRDTIEQSRLSGPIGLDGLVEFEVLVRDIRHGGNIELNVIETMLG